MHRSEGVGSSRRQDVGLDGRVTRERARGREGDGLRSVGGDGWGTNAGEGNCRVVLINGHADRCIVIEGEGIAARARDRESREVDARGELNPFSTTEGEGA